MAAYTRLKNEFIADEKYHNLMSLVIYECVVVNSSQ